MTELANELLTPDESAQLAASTHEVMYALRDLRHTIEQWLIVKGIDAADREVLQDAITDQIIEGSRKGVR